MATPNTWSPAEDAQLYRMSKLGHSDAEIAAKLRSHDAVSCCNRRAYLRRQGLWNEAVLLPPFADQFNAGVGEVQE